MELPHTYTDCDGDALRVTEVGISVKPLGVASAAVRKPTGDAAVALARAVLAAAGNTGHEVARTDEIDAYRARSARGFELTCEVRQLRQQRADLRARVRDVEAVAESMRERSVAALEALPYPDDAQDLIRALPLFPDEPARTPLTADTDT